MADRPKPTQNSLRVIKTFDYRGATQRWSNRYFIDQSPQDWHALFNALQLIEVSIHRAAVKIIEIEGLAPGSDVPVATQPYNAPGTLGTASAGEVPGACAACVRWATTKRSKKNHPVYLFSYYHDSVYQQTGGDRDTLHPTMLTAMQNYGQDWVTGITVGGQTFKRVTPDGHPVTASFVHPKITHRDFPD